MQLISSKEWPSKQRGQERGIQHREVMLKGKPLWKTGVTNNSQIRQHYIGLNREQEDYSCQVSGVLLDPLRTLPSATVVTVHEPFIVCLEIVFVQIQYKRQPGPRSCLYYLASLVRQHKRIWDQARQKHYIEKYLCCVVGCQIHFPVSMLLGLLPNQPHCN